MEGELEAFQQFLRNRGLKLTQQRAGILRRILQIDKHFSADDLFEILRREGHRASKATVYRTLALLVEAGIVDDLDFERGHRLYERHTVESHHDHLICLSCKRIFEFHCEEIERQQESIAERYDFRMVSHTHHIYGVCGRCQRRGLGAEFVARQAPGSSISSR